MPKAKVEKKEITTSIEVIDGEQYIIVKDEKGEIISKSAI